MTPSSLNRRASGRPDAAGRSGDQRDPVLVPRGVLSGVLTVGGPHADHEWTDVARMPERAALVARMVELLLREG